MVAANAMICRLLTAADVSRYASDAGSTRALVMKRDALDARGGEMSVSVSASVSTERTMGERGGDIDVLKVSGIRVASSLLTTATLITISPCSVNLRALPEQGNETCDKASHHITSWHHTAWHNIT